MKTELRPALFPDSETFEVESPYEGGSSRLVTNPNYPPFVVTVLANGEFKIDGVLEIKGSRVLVSPQARMQ